MLASGSKTQCKATDVEGKIGLVRSCKEGHYALEDSSDGYSETFSSYVNSEWYDVPCNKPQNRGAAGAKLADHRY